MYAVLIGDALAEERANKTAIDQRAAGVITTSGALAALLFGFTTFAPSADRGLDLSTAETSLLRVGLAFFIVAAALAIGALMPRRYAESAPAQLQRLLEPSIWQGPAEIATRRVAELNITIFDHHRTVNRKKVKWLIWAFGFQAAAVAVLGIAVAAVLG